MSHPKKVTPLHQPAPIMNTPAAFLTPPLIHVCMQCVCRYGHWWPGCDGAEGERFNTLTGRLAVSVRTFPASSGWGKILVGVRVLDATYSIRLLLLTTCHGWELLGINSTPKIDSREFKSSGNSPLNQYLAKFCNGPGILSFIMAVGVGRHLG